MVNTDGHLFRTFNPGLAQTDAEIIDQFVVRHDELQVVVDTIRENLASDICQSLLIIGQRGSGKTMLLARVAAELRRNTEYQSVIPVRFAEESDEVIDATRFWLELLRQLSQEIRTSEPELAEEANATLQDLSDRWRDSTAEDRAQSAALRLMHRLDRKVILMVENLQSIFSSADASFGWKLREALQSSSRLMLIGTATLRFEGMERVDMPFFEFFRVVNLEPLKLDACKELWNTLTRGRFPTRQARPLEILTGGNPRLLVIASNFAFHDSLKRLMDELIRLIDQYTEYFKSRLEEIPTKERIVFLSMLDLWQDSTLKEIATRARMSSRSVSGLLNRLTARGAIVKLGSGRKHFYSVNERLFCFYYKLRYQHDGVAVVEYLVNFMVSFYSGAELRQLRQAISEEAKTTPFIFDGLIRAKENFRFTLDGEARTRYENSAEVAHKSIANLLWVNEIIERSKGGLKKRFRGDETVLQTKRSDKSQESVEDLSTIKSTLDRVMELTKQFEYDKALGVLGDVFRNLDSNPSRHNEVFRAFLVFQIGELSSSMRRNRDTEYAFDYIVDRFSESDEPIVRKIYIETLKAQSSVLADDGRVDEALTKLDTAIEYLENLEREGTLTQGGYLTYRNIVDIRVQRGILLRENGKLEECLDILTKTLEADRTKCTQDEESVWEMVQIERGITLRELNRSEESIRTLKDVVESTPLDKEIPWNTSSIQAYRQLALSQLQNNPSSALTTLKRLIKSLDESGEATFDLESARLLEKKASIEMEQEDAEAAEATRKQLYDRFHESREAFVRSVVCDSLFSRCVVAFGKEQWDQLKLASTRLNRLAVNLPNIPSFNRNRFDALYIRMLVLVFFDAEKKAKALSTFREFAVTVEQGNANMMKTMLRLTKVMLTLGTKEADLITTLSGKSRNDMVLRPLVIALRMGIGDDVREPREILEVARDVHREIYIEG